jgi:hypothetical protein
MTKKVAIIKRGRGELPGAAKDSMQSRLSGTVLGSDNYLLPMLVNWGEIADELPVWWSPARDQELRRMWHKDGILASTIYTMQAVLSTIGWVIEGSPKDVEASKVPFENAEFGEGFKVCIKKLIEDWLTQDNGIFLELIGPGNPELPLLTPPEGIAHLDAGRCWRTGDPEYPIWYMGFNRSWKKVHWTRICYSAANPSAIELARGLGFSAASRVAAISRVMRDTVRYKMEKVSGRQTRAIMTVSGAPIKAVQLAMEEAERAADNADQMRFSAIPIIAAPSGGTKIEASLLELAKVPDGFTWENELQMYAYILALALGIDARELWPATQSGATKADAEVQHRKAMRKGVGDFISTIEFMANQRIVLGDAVFGFKPKDNEEDKAQADVEKVRVDTVSGMITSGVVTPRGALLYLVNKGVLPIEYLSNPVLAAAETTPQPLIEQAPPDAGPASSETAVEPATDNTPTSSDQIGRVGTAVS